MPVKKNNAKGCPKTNQGAGARPGPSTFGSTTSRQVPQEAPPGLDGRRHTVAQRAAQQAEILRVAYVPAALAAALNMDGRIDGNACRIYLDRFLEDAGDPSDPVQRVLLEQVAVLRLRLADLHTQAARAKSVEATKILTGATARLLGEVRRLAVTLRELKGSAPKEPKLRIANGG